MKWITSYPTPSMTEFNQEKQTCVIDKDSIIFNALIGEGGFGRVLSGMLVQNRTWYAIKEINKYSVTKHQTGLTMLFSELKALQVVNVEPQCSFIVSLQAAFHDKSSCYLVLDLKGGGDLRFYLRKRLIFEESDVAFYVSCIGSALEFIHSRNILHRDVKPENIILDSRGYPHLTDFGVAYVQPPGTEGVLTCRLASGTKQYLAPEVYCKSNVHGIASDYWSLGVLAFELLFGQRPFEKHCPSLHIAYLEESLKRTATKSALRRELQRDISSPSLDSSPQRGPRSDPSSPFSTHGTASCSSNMTTASTQRTEALQTKDALFSRKKREFRNFHDLSGTVDMSASYSRFEEKSNIDRAEESKSVYETCKSQDLGPAHGTRTLCVEGFEGEGVADASARVRGKLMKNITLKEREEAEDMQAATGGGREEKKDSRSQSSTPTRREAAEQIAKFDDTEYITVDHWTVHAHELPVHLQVLVPKESDWLGLISESCVKVLEGFFDVRPSHRIGGHNLADLKQHQWFKDTDTPSWEALQTKEYVPKFAPEKKFMKNTYWRQDSLISYQKSLLPENTVVLPDIDAEQEALFDRFEHSSEALLSLFHEDNKYDFEAFEEVKAVESNVTVTVNNVTGKARRGDVDRLGIDTEKRKEDLRNDFKYRESLAM